MPLVNCQRKEHRELTQRQDFLYHWLRRELKGAMVWPSIIVDRPARPMAREPSVSLPSQA